LQYPVARQGAWKIACIVVLLALAVALPGCSPAKQSGRLKVAVSIVPLADFVRQVGDGLVEVETLVPPGASAHTYEPTARQLAFLTQAGLFVTNGLQLETWASSVVDKVGNRELLKVVASDAIPRSRLIKAGQYGGERDLAGPYDPHVWLDPALAAYEVDAVAAGLAKADPTHAATYMKNAAAYKQKLKTLDSEIASRTAAFSKKDFVALHPAWAYFARRYGLTQAGAIEELPGQEPSGKKIKKLIDDIIQRKIDVVFAEPQTNPKAAQVVADEAGARLLFLDALGNPDKPDVSTYIKMVRHDAAVMEEALR